MKNHSQQIADLVLLLSVKMKKENVDLFDLPVDSNYLKISQDYDGLEETGNPQLPIAIIDEERTKMVLHIQDLLVHRLIYGHEFDDLYTAMHLNLCNGDLAIFE